MDPLSITASITALLQITNTTIRYLYDVGNATNDRMKLVSEASQLISLLPILSSRVEQAKSGDPWLDTVKTLSIQNGPLDQLKSDLERLASKLVPGKGLSDVKQRLTWMFNKEEVMNILMKIERMKTLVTLALTNDLS